MHENQQIYNEIFDFLKEHSVLTLATSGDSPWVCTLYYGMDENMNFYVVSDPNSEHGKDLKQNKKVAFNIFDSHTKITEPKKGIQAKGNCEIVTGITECTKGLFLWHQSNPGIEAKITIKEIIEKLSDTKIYKITPSFMKFFNKQLYGEKEYGILNF